MRPTFMGLETTRRGLAVNQKALDITANNISNLKTPGYTRQRLDSVSMNLAGGSRFPVSSVGLAGQGVKAAGVAQIRNTFLDTRFREEYGDVGYYDQKAAILSEIESAISDPEVESTGIKDALKNLYSALADFSANADSTTHANIVQNTFKGVTHALNQYDTKLNQIYEQEMKNFEISVNDINSKFEQISALNKSIVDAIFMNTDYDGINYGPNELMDQRNVLLDELARYGDVRVQTNEDGSIKVEFNGRTAVDADSGNYKFDQIDFSSENLSLTWGSTGGSVGLETGALKGFMDVLTGSNPLNKGIPYYKSKLDAMAVKLVDVFNQVVPNDAADGAFPYKTLLEGGGDGTVTAGSITISEAWAKDPSYILRPENPDGDADNEFVLAMKSLLDSDINFSDEFSGTFSEYVSFITTALGSDITLNNSRLDSCISVTQSIDDDRMGVSGVSLNEEGINMMTYEKAFNAMSRLMTVMDEQLDKLINSTGLVGR